jgi:phage baseplate assembly protein gpV
MSARTIPDVSMIARAIQRPGIDPRAWVSLAIVQSVVVGTDGAFCDVLLVPSNRLHTARLGAAYAGSGWGLFLPPLVDDEVVVLAPDGDPSAGLVIVSRLWSQVDAPPTEAQANPEDAVLVVQPDKSLRLLVSGGGKVIMGDAASAKGVARLDDTVAGGTFSITSAGLIATFNYTPPGGIPVVIGSITLGGGSITPGSATLSGKIDSASETVEAS